MLSNLSPWRILFPLFRCLFAIGKALSKTIWFTSKDPVTTYTKWHLRVKRVFSRHTRRTGVGRTATTCRSHETPEGYRPRVRASDRLYSLIPAETLRASPGVTLRSDGRTNPRYVDIPNLIVDPVLSTTGITRAFTLLDDAWI